MSTEHNRRRAACACECDTVMLSAAAACSLEPADNVSWPGGTSGREGAGCYWEETNQCRATAAPSPSPHCTCTHTQTQTHTPVMSEKPHVDHRVVEILFVCLCFVRTLCDYRWAAWGSDRRSRPWAARPSALLQRSDLWARWLNGPVWTGSRPCTSSQVQLKSRTKGGHVYVGAENLLDLTLAATVQEIWLFGSNFLQ